MTFGYFEEIIQWKWKYYINIYLKEVGSEAVCWINLAQDRSQWWNLVNTTD
jgi:hypothetical protein